MYQSEWNTRLSRGCPRKPGEGKRIQAAFIPLGFTKTHPCYLFLLLEEPRSASQIYIFSIAHSFIPQSSSQLWMVQLKGTHGHLTVKDQLASRFTKTTNTHPNSPIIGFRNDLVNLLTYKSREGKIISYFAFLLTWLWHSPRMWFMFKEKLACFSAFSTMPIQFN